MAKVPKNRVKVDSLVDPSRKYTIEEACALVGKVKFAKFDETVDVAVRLGVNPKHADQMVRGALVLPNGTGQTVKVLVFAKGDKEAEARAAGADLDDWQRLLQAREGGKPECARFPPSRE